MNAHYELWRLKEIVRLEMYYRTEPLLHFYMLRYRLRVKFHRMKKTHLHIIPHAPLHDNHPWTVTIKASSKGEKEWLISVDKMSEFPSDLTLTKLMLLGG